MNRKLLIPLIAALGLSLGACQKQQTEAERNAEIERQVQQRLDGEHQADEQQKLVQRQAELDARERALAEKENRPAATATPAAIAATPAPAAATPVRAIVGSDTESGSYATFYRKLDPYGDWMETNDYGYVFQPRQAAQSRDWRPYTNGHWVYTDAGWTWISDEQFGWATYHYGRWIRLRSVGWVWVPGDEWAPAWVSWRKGNDYVGWAPLPPEAQFDRQTGIRNWADNYYDIGPEQYAFVPANQFGAKVSARVVLPTAQNVTIINQTINITNITYNNSVIVDRGPSYDDLRARSREPIERFRLERTQNSNNDRPVFRGEVVSLPTMDFRPAERATRPARVSRTIAQTVAERGWAGIQDAKAAQKARNKMQAEATPPPNAPPKLFVRPDLRPIIPPRPAATSISTPVAALPPSSTPARPATPVATPALPVRPSRPGASPHPGGATFPVKAATPVPHGTPVTATTPARPPASRLPTLTPAPSVEPTPPRPTENVFSPKAADRNRQQGHGAAREERQKEREQAQAQRRAEREKQLAERRGNKAGRPEPSPASPTITATPALPAPTATPAPAAGTPALASPTPALSHKEKAAERRRDRREARKERRNQAHPDSSPTPEASASPTATQP